MTSLYPDQLTKGTPPTSLLVVESELKGDCPRHRILLLRTRYKSHGLLTRGGKVRLVCCHTQIVFHRCNIVPLEMAFTHEILFNAFMEE